MANQNQNQGSTRNGTQNRGFASMSEAEQREIARMGGAAVSENREHMAAIGRRGGEASAEARAALRGAARGEGNATKQRHGPADQAGAPTDGSTRGGDVGN
jgi:general stress protein YciG